MGFTRGTVDVKNNGDVGSVDIVDVGDDFVIVKISTIDNPAWNKSRDSEEQKSTGTDKAIHAKVSIPVTIDGENVLYMGNSVDLFVRVTSTRPHLDRHETAK